MGRVVSRANQAHPRPDGLPVAEAGELQGLSACEAYEAAYRFVARYYDYERVVPILRLLDAISWNGDHPDSNEKAWAAWRACVQETRDREPLPELPPPWA